MWYTGIFIMMMIESSFVPFPSEIAMIPAWYLSALWEMNLVYAFFAGTWWALVWASVNYILGWKLWWPIVRMLIKRYGSYIFLSVEHYEYSEKYFQKHGSITTLAWRFIPAVRQLISIPAWIFCMNYGKFLLFTFIGAGLWNAILLSIWYLAGKNDELIHQLLSQTFVVILIVLIVSIWGYIFYKKHQV